MHKSKRENRIGLLESFLRKHQKSKAHFTKAEMSDFTGYPIGTITTYFGKYLLNYLVFLTSDNKYASKGIEKLTSHDFVIHMSQKSEKVKIVYGEPLVIKLRQRSLDAFCVAMENYNRLTLKNRIEVFCILMANAWELLLKSQLICRSGVNAIKYKDSNNTLSLRDSANEFFSDNSPIKRNIEILAELRDASIHLLIPELQRELSRIFQASVLNFRDCYKSFVGTDPFPEQPLGLMSLVVESQDLTHNLIFKEYDEYTGKQVEQFLKKFQTEEKEFSSSQFAIPVEYKLALVKKELESDISLSFNPNSPSAIIIEKAAPISKTHPHRATRAIELINAKTKKSAPKINMWEFRALLNKCNIINDSRYYNHEEISGTKSYSEQLIDKFVNLLNSNPEAFDNAKKSFKGK